MQTRYGQSPWIAALPASKRPSLPRLRGELAADVVIVGAGLTGCATAVSCALAGLKPLVIEAERVGLAAGRASGLLLPDPGPSFRDITKRHGLRAAKLVFGTWRRAALDAAAQLRRLSISCNLEPRESLIIGPQDDGGKGLLREYDAREAAGVASSWLTRRQITALTPLDVPAAMRARDGFLLDPYRACLGLANAAARRGATFFEQSRVKKVRVGRRNVEIVVDGGLVKAGTVIVATGSATPEFRPLRRHFKMREVYHALTEPMPAAVRKQVGNRSVTVRDAEGAGRRVVWTPDGRLLVLGGDQDETPARRRSDVLVQRTGDLMYQALTMYPAIVGLQPEWGWEASYGETADGLPYIGPHRNYPRHLFALGGSGDSLTGAFLAARILVRALQDHPEKSDQVFGWTR
jgi:glycine/D-amino acid oxidase-like deaminating enzyme